MRVAGVITSYDWCQLELGLSYRTSVKMCAWLKAVGTGLAGQCKCADKACCQVLDCTAAAHGLATRVSMLLIVQMFACCGMTVCLHSHLVKCTAEYACCLYILFITNALGTR